MRYTRCFADRYMMEHIYHDFFFERANEFKFWNVGQGLFYTGSLFDGKFNFVYDCGGSSKIIKSRVCEYVNKVCYNKEIDVLFISHFHKDHINGIKYLKDKGCKIKKIVVPYYGYSKNYILLRLVEGIKTSFELYELIETWYILSSILNEHNLEQDIVQVSNDNDNNVYSYNYDRDNNFVRASSASPKVWNFVVANNQSRDIVDSINRLIDYKLRKFKSESLEQYFEFDRGINHVKNQLKKLLDIDDDCKKNLSKDVYQDLTKIDFCKNEDSVTLLHYPLSKDSLFEIEQSNCVLKTNNGCCLDITPIKCHAPATLLTGDGAVLQNSNMQLEKYSDNDEISTKVMQIPHHGAKEEWSKTVGNLLSNRKYCFENYVVSYGFGNNYGHPTYELIDDLAQHNIEERLYSATQFTTFEYTILNR